MFDAVAVTLVGGSGVVYGVAGADGDDAVPIPTFVLATHVNV